MTPGDSPKPIRRRPRKTPEQRGQVGAWTYDTMVRLGLTDEQIADRVGVGSVAIRKFMGSSKGELGAESRARLLAFYREVAGNKKIPIDDPPVGFIVAGAGSDTPVPASYLNRIDTLTALVGQLVLQNAELMAAAKLTPPVTDAMRTDLAALMASSSSLLRDAPRSGTKA